MLKFISCVVLLVFIVSCGNSEGGSHPAVSGFKAYSFSERPFPDDNYWNQNISQAEVDPDSATYIQSLGASGTLHAAFGTVWDGAPNGIPFIVVSGNQPKVPVSFLWASSSDPGPYPIPDDIPIQGGADSDGDRHAIIIDKDNGLLYEFYRLFPDGNGKWKADAGAIFDLKTNSMRPDTWTSADAAGLPIFPGLVRYEEVVEQKEIRHALRFTANQTRRAYVFPATHQAGSTTSTAVIPMGARLRLKASYDISKYSANVQVILRALKTYGMFVADNGVSWQIGGAPHENWDDQELSALRQVPGSAFEVIKLGPLKYTPW